MNKIVEGSVVRLKGQDVNMTVERIIKPTVEETIYSYVNLDNPSAKAKCVWFIGKELYKDTFSLESLELI